MNINRDANNGNLRTLAGDEQIKKYYAEQLKVLVLGDKNPFNPYRADGKQWQREYVQQEDALAHYTRGGNIGLQMGEVSGWLCAADLDVEEARRLAPFFIPSTLMGGKEHEALLSAYVYRSEGCGYLGIKDVGGGELLALKASADGAGHQIKVAPSVHPAKGAYEWRPGFDMDAIRDVGADSLHKAIRRLAIASLIRRYLPDHGRHEYSKAIGGTLCRRGYDPDDLAEILRIVWDDAGAPSRDGESAARNVYDTARKLEEDEKVTGGTTLNEIVSGLASALIKAAGLERNQAFGGEIGAENGGPADDSDLARLWLYKNKDAAYSPHGWLRYRGGWWHKVDEGVVTQDILRLVDRTPGKVSANRLKSVANLAQHHSYASGDAWDANQDIIVCTNGTLDLNTFKLRDHRPEDRALGGLPFDYDSDAKAEAWNHFIGARLRKGEWEFLQEFVGYALTTDCSHELAVWLVGEGGTGKSTFVEGVQRIAGNRAAGLSLTDLERSPFALENVVGRTLLTATEQPGTFIRYVDLLNKIISGEEIQINRKNKPIVDVRSTAKILWAMNRTPQIREEGSGFFRRIHPITFPPFEGKKAPGVKERITQLEGPGILAWAVEGLKRLRERDAFDVPASIREAMVEYEYNNDPAAQFLAELCEKGENFETSSARLHEVYAAWCKHYGYKPKAKNTAGEEWRRLKVAQGRSKTKRWWKVRILEDSDTYERLNLFRTY
jgi:P4 family phage/plasmid primase-like protien